MVKKFLTRDEVDELRDKLNVSDSELISNMGVDRDEFVKLMKGQRKRICVNC